jgi:DnaJ-class molecular chaperone
MRKLTCTSCDGKGGILVTQPHKQRRWQTCPDCSGTGIFLTSLSSIQTLSKTEAARLLLLSQPRRTSA